MPQPKQEPSRRHSFPVENYDLAETLNSGQAFRWGAAPGASWEGVVAGHWVALKSRPGIILAQTAEPVADWTWLESYLQINAELESIISTFPEDPQLHSALRCCPGLRLLRQEPWECLASFILSSTKRIVQIRQVVENLCRCFGPPLAVPESHAPVHDFPSARRLAALSESELRHCRAGFRSPYLREAARRVANGELDLPGLGSLPIAVARDRLMALPGVGPKIADCVLLFAYDFPMAFPLDVWVVKALRRLYFGGRNESVARLREFAAEHFGPNAGYAQQYLFHYMRTKLNRSGGSPRPSLS